VFWFLFDVQITSAKQRLAAVLYLWRPLFWFVLDSLIILQNNGMSPFYVLAMFELVPLFDFLTILQNSCLLLSLILATILVMIVLLIASLVGVFWGRQNYKSTYSHWPWRPRHWGAEALQLKERMRLLLLLSFFDINYNLDKFKTHRQT
jgi:hypothetical protein